MLPELNRKGFIPGPEETEEQFFARVSLAKDSTSIPLSEFGIEPSWIPVFYDNKKLPFFQGAATWIENGIPRIQLRKKQPFGYSSEEILSHEAIHAVRVAFEEPKFEEILAYQTSRSKFRKFFGPIFQRSWESTFFVALVLLGLIPYLQILPWIFLCYLLVRLVRNQKIFAKCKKNLSLPVLLCLTDKEITLFSRKENILPYVAEAKNHSLRWKMLYESHFM